MDQHAKVVPLRQWTKDYDARDTRKFFEDLRNNTFVTVVVYDDGRVVVFSKDLDPGKLDLIREAFNDSYTEPERTADGNT